MCLLFPCLSHFFCFRYNAWLLCYATHRRSYYLQKCFFLLLHPHNRYTKLNVTKHASAPPVWLSEFIIFLVFVIFFLFIFVIFSYCYKGFHWATILNGQCWWDPLLGYSFIKFSVIYSNSLNYFQARDIIVTDSGLWSICWNVVESVYCTYTLTLFTLARNP